MKSVHFTRSTTTPIRLLGLLAIVLFSHSCSFKDESRTGIIDETETVTGQVLDSLGTPVAGALVALHGDSISTSQVSLTKASIQTIQVTTDSLGCFTIHGSFKGKAYVEVDYHDSIASLDSIQFSGQATITIPSQTLVPKAIIHLETRVLLLGEEIWLPQLNRQIIITPDNDMDIRVPTGFYSISLFTQTKDSILISSSLEAPAGATIPVNPSDYLPNRSESPLNMDTIAAWEFNYSADPGFDFSANRHHANLAEGQVTTNDSAAIFNGASGLRVRLASQFLRNDFVLEAKVYPTSFGALNNIVVAEPPGNMGDGWILRMENGKVTFNVRDEVSGSTWNSISSPALALNTWATIRAQRNGTKNRLWINGVLVDSATVTGDISTLQYDLGIGYDAMNQAIHNRYFAGQVDYIRILSSSASNQVFDVRDGRTYTTVRIGTQTWMAQNLNYGILDSATSTLQSATVKYCYLNDSLNCNNEGGLYQWHHALNLPDSCASTNCSALIQEVHQGLCPAGFHVPDSADWGLLANTLGGALVAGGKMKLNTTSDSSFNASIYNDGNSAGFSALPAGIRYFVGNFAYHGGEVQNSQTMWEATDDPADNYLNAYRQVVNNEGTALSRLTNHLKKDAFTVRCLKN